MARQDVYRKYDENGNVVDEVRLDEGTSEYEAAKKAREGGGGQVGNYYIKNGTGDITKKNNLADYASDLTELYTPVIKVNKAGDGLVISGSKTAINNDMAKQLQSYLDDTFKYADLKSESVAEALEALNKDLYSQVEERVVSGGIGMNYDDYKEYRNTLQQLQGTNPLKSTGVVPGYDRDGKKVYKTIADWIAYYRSYYSTSERADLFRGALALMEGGNTDPALWTPYLAMSGGTGASPVYGFDTGERLSTGWESFMNEMAKLIQGGAQNAVRTVQYLQNIGGYNRRDKLNKVAHEIELGRKVNSSEVKWMSEDNFNKKLESIIGKRVGELNSSEKTFLATAVAGNMNSDQMKDVMAAISDNGVITDDIRNLATYKSYIDERDNLSTTEKYDVEMDKAVDAVNSGRDWLQRDVNLGSIYAPVETTVGAFAGTMLRMWAEAGLIKYATGGVFNPAEISDFLAGKLISGLEKIAPASGALRALQTPVGSFLLSVTAELPEDVVQTVIDDVMIGRGEDIPLLAPTGDINKDMEKLGESFAQNLAFRLAFTPLHVGAQKLRAWRAAKNAASAVDMDATVSDQLFMRNQQLKDAADKGNIVDLTEDSATIRNPDGTETVLDNVAMLHFGTDPELQERYPAIAEMVRKKGLVADVAEVTDVDTKVEAARKAVENGEYEDVSVSIVPKTEADLDGYNTAKGLQYQNEEITTYRGQPYSTSESFVYNSPDAGKKLAELNGTDADYGYGDAYFFTGYKPWATEFGDTLVEFTFKESDTLSFDDYFALRQKAESYNLNDPTSYRSYAELHGEENAALMKRIANNSFRAAAEYTNKPVIMATEGTIAPEWLYYKGVNEDFDKAATTRLLYSLSPEYEQASAANLKMANEIQKSLDTQPYDRSAAEIVADKYAENAKTMGEAPSSASYKWESPDVTKVYKTEEEVFADRPVGKNMTEVRQWQKNAESFYMNKYREDVVPKFRESYPTVDEQQQFVRNMDFLFDQQRVGGEDLVVKPVEAQSEQPVVVKTDDGIVYTVSDKPGVETAKYRNNNGEIDLGKEKWLSSMFRKNTISTPERLRFEGSLVDSSPTQVFDEVQKTANSDIREALREKGYGGLTADEKEAVDFVDSVFTQKMNEPMVLYRGEPKDPRTASLKVGDKINGDSWTFTTLSQDYTTNYRTKGKKGGVLYRYHTKAGQPAYFYPPINEVLLPRELSGSITSIKNNAAGKVFGKFIPEKIIDVEVDLSGVSGGTAVKWGDGDSPADEWVAKSAKTTETPLRAGETQLEPGTAEYAKAEKQVNESFLNKDYVIPDRNSGKKHFNPDGYAKFGKEQIDFSDHYMTPAEAFVLNTIRPGGDIDMFNGEIRRGTFKEQDIGGNLDTLREVLIQNFGDETMTDPVVMAAYGVYDDYGLADFIERANPKSKEFKGAVDDMLVNGNARLKEPRVFFKGISKEGNHVNEAGDFSWLDSGKYDDESFQFASLDEDAAHSFNVDGKENYIIRYHLPEDYGVFYYGHVNRGAANGGAIVIPPIKDATVVRKGGSASNGAEYVDVYVGDAKKNIDSDFAPLRTNNEPLRPGLETLRPGLGSSEVKDYEVSGSVIGKTYENEGITYTVNEDDVRFYLDNIEPMMKNLREAGAAGQGREAFTITGYLPHSDYDPTLLTAEDAMQQGVLWREYTGASTTAEDGTFTTGWLDSDLEARYRTFVNNMLWDSLGEEVTIAKFMEELNADGLDVDVDKVIQLVGGRKRFAEIVSKSDSAKAVAKSLVGDGKLPADTELDEAASKMGATDKVHELYQPVYGSSTGLNQRGNVALMSKSDWMRSLTTGDGSLYDNGGAMIVNGSADAKFMAKRIFEAVENGEKLDTHKMFVEYLTQNHRRTAKGASYIADKWMDKIAQKTSNGGITRRALTAELSRLIYNEGANRVFRFIGRMDTSKLNASNRKALDSLLFRHSMLSKVMNTSGFTAKLNRATNKLISARMKSLFWLNFKNAVLQSSECIRLFTEFKLGDALDTIKRMASDKEFMKEVDEWVDMLVPERYIKGDSSAAIDAAATIAGKSSYANGELTVEKLSRGEINGISKKFDEFASSPVEMGESLKNRVLMAGILQEAHNKGLSGNELFSYVNERFQRIGLAANEMGRLNASDSPLFRLGANLKTFQIRQLSMFLNNINDMNGPKEAVTYILKNLGWKAGLVVILSKLGYSAAATLGIDPFDLMDDDYTGVDEDNYTGLDYLVLSPAGKLFLSGGFTGYINDLYWASRKAYEDSAEITEETENRLDKGFWPGMALPGTSFDDVLNSFTGFIPGYTAGKRVVQMNELLDTGWATSATGNKMYTAPDNIFDIAGGYAFGRSNTPNARAYYQTPDYLQGFIDNGFEGLGQQIGREWGAYRQFDPIDSYGYSDWFNGSAADEQQWNSGYYYFLNKVRDMNREYSNSLSEYTTDEQKQSLRDSYNKRLAEVEEQISRFTRAYESKHPEGIDARKMKNLINVLNIYQPVVSDTPEEAKQRSLDAYSDALYRYTQAGLPAVTSYKRNDEGEIEEVYSPQVRSAIQGQFGLPEEAATQIKQLYKDKWKELNQKYRNRLFSTSGSKAKKAIQNEYINIVRQDLDPIVRLYGNNIWSNEEVENIIDDVFNSMIPKYGQTPKSYLKNLYKNYTGAIRYNESGNTTLSQINNLLDQGKTAQAKALARTLLQRVQENRTYLDRSEMERLQAILND